MGSERVDFKKFGEPKKVPERVPTTQTGTVYWGLGEAREVGLLCEESVQGRDYQLIWMEEQYTLHFHQTSIGLLETSVFVGNWVGITFRNFPKIFPGFPNWVRDFLQIPDLP